MSTLSASSSDDVRLSMQDVFLLRPVNRDFLQGRSRFVSGGRYMIAGLVGLFVVLLLALVPVYGIIRSWYEWNSLNIAGVLTEGEFVDRSVSSAEGVDYYVVSYRYSHNGVEYVHNQDVSQALYDQVEIGKEVSILYAPNDPNNAFLAGSNEPPSIIEILFAVGMSIIVGGIVFVFIRRVNAAQRLSREGRFIMGTIESCTGEMDEDGYSVTVSYSFVEPDGNQRIEGRASDVRDDLKSKGKKGQPNEQLPAAGTPVAVLYRNAKHYMLL